MIFDHAPSTHLDNFFGFELLMSVHLLDADFSDLHISGARGWSVSVRTDEIVDKDPDEFENVGPHLTFVK